MNKHSVAIILPYYGKFPNYFPLWLKSAGANPSFTFMIFTDIDMSRYNVPPNVHVHTMSLEDVRTRAAQHLAFAPLLNTPYKLCDYRIMYGLIFEDYIAGYDFWGFCDCDLIFGDMSKFITDYLLDKYSRLYHLGHIQLFRNTDKINHFALHKLSGWNISYEDVFKSSINIAYDESPLTENLFDQFAGCGNSAQYDRAVFADVDAWHKNFIRTQYYILCERIPAFRWTHGKLYGLALDGDPECEQEYLYVHFQKRQMKFTPGLENADSFMAIPNEFVSDHELTQKEIDTSFAPDPDYTREVNAKYRKNRTLLERVRTFCSHERAGNLVWLKMRWNKLLGRSLPSRYTQPH